MEDKDHLKELLGKIDEVNEPIDLERAILTAIQQQESSKLQIARYRANGIKALIASGILIIVLGILFSFPSSVRSVEHSIVTYTSIILVLIVLFIQLEMASTKKFNHLKNNLS
jgi:protein-S-isoprenylcysteine O-methyltransferase Ste14